jgi:hypothetical protein
MNKKSLSTGRALQVIVPFALIIVASFAGIEWLGLVGTVVLAWVIASALLREPRTENLPPLRGLWFALAVPIITGLVLIPLVIYMPPFYILAPALVAGIVAVYVALGYLMWWFVRLNRASDQG